MILKRDSNYIINFVTDEHFQSYFEFSNRNKVIFVSIANLYSVFRNPILRKNMHNVWQ